MYKEEDWGKLYYAVITTTARGRKKVLATGSTIIEAKVNAITVLSRKVGSRRFRSYHGIINDIDLNVFCPVRADRSSRIGIVYCEAKVRIYGERWGYDDMFVEYDPCLEDNLLRYLKYKFRKNESIGEEL